MTRVIAVTDSQTSKIPHWGLRIFTPDFEFEASSEGVIRYIGHFLFPQSLTTPQSTVLPFTAFNQSCFITFAHSGSLGSSEIASIQPPTYITDRELDEAWVKNQIARLHAEIIGCFSGIMAGEIEDGMSNDLGERIKNLLNEHKDLAVHLFGAIVHSQQVPEDVLSHALRWMGRIKHEETFHDRLWLLRSCLRSPSPIIRDGAALGIAASGSRQAISSLQQAIDRERLPSLRADLIQVLKELESNTQ